MWMSHFTHIYHVTHTCEWVISHIYTNLTLMSHIYTTLTIWHLWGHTAFEINTESQDHVTYEWLRVKINVSWLIHMWHDSHMSESCHFEINTESQDHVTYEWESQESQDQRLMTHSYVTWLIHVCAMTHSCMWHDVSTWDMTHSYVTWLIHISCVMRNTHSSTAGLVRAPTINTQTKSCACEEVLERRDSFTSPVWDVNDRDTDVTHLWHDSSTSPVSHLWHDSSIWEMPHHVQMLCRVHGRQMDLRGAKFVRCWSWLSRYWCLTSFSETCVAVCCSVLQCVAVCCSVILTL